MPFDVRRWVFDVGCSSPRPSPRRARTVPGIFTPFGVELLHGDSRRRLRLLQQLQHRAVELVPAPVFGVHIRAAAVEDAIRMLENHWKNYKTYARDGNPWKISYGMNQYTSADFPASNSTGQPPNGTTARLGSVRQPTDTLLIADLSFLLNHPAIIYLAKTDVGYKHGGRLHQADGKANMVFMDAHVEGRSLKQTNGIVMEFKK